jgi:hypothetical protein
MVWVGILLVFMNVVPAAGGIQYPMTDKLAKWESVRAKGRTRFVLERGVLGWGVPMFVIMTFVVNRHSPNALLSPRNYVIFSAFLWAGGGALFGLATWWQGERKYKKSLEASESAPESD